MATAKIKVSQATIDNIKKMGMTKALASAKSANPEMKEALTRMYGAARVAKAAGPVKSTAASQPKPKTAQYARGEKPVMTNAGTNPRKPVQPKSGGYKGSDADKFVSGVKRILNSSPGANLGGTAKKVGAAFTPDWKKKEAAMKAAKNKSK